MVSTANASFSGFIQLSPNIYVPDQTLSPSESGFIDNLKNDLAILSSKEEGNKLIRKLGASSRPIICINEFFTWDASNGSITPPNKPTISCVIIRFTFNHITLQRGLDLNPIPNPSFAVLAHELIHAEHYAYDQLGETTCPEGLYKTIWTCDEEFNTIIRENVIRNEHGLPPRFGHANETLSNTLAIRRAAKRFKKTMALKAC